MSAEKIEAIKPMLADFSGFTEAVQQEVQAEQQKNEDEVAKSVLLSALVEAAYLVAVADGEVTQEEADQLQKGIDCLTNNEMPDGTIQTYYDVAVARLENFGAEERFKAVGQDITDPDMRKGAMAVATALSWLGHGVGVKEGLALQALARSFDMSIHEMQVILGMTAQHIK